MKPPLRLLAVVSAALSCSVLPILAAPGDLDPLEASVADPEYPTVYSVAEQPDGKIIIAGLFRSLMGVPRENIARLHANGTLDTGFNPKVGSDLFDSVFCVAVQPDGKVLLGGNFMTVQPNGAATPTARQFVARLNSDGSLDTGFNPKANGAVFGIAVQPDGKVVLGGSFNYLQPNGATTPTLRQGIARVNASGTLDTGFDPKPNDEVYAVALQTDGKVLLAGFFDRIQPNGAATASVRQGIARVNSSGTLDTVFNPHANSPVRCVIVQPDGKVLMGGNFTALQPNAGEFALRNHLARVNADGTLDTGFDPGTDSDVGTMALQADGKVLFGGTFTTVYPGGGGPGIARGYVARVDASGALDAAFAPAPNNLVECVAVQADGKIILGGYFTTLQPNGAAVPTARHRFARLQNAPATQVLSAPSSTQALWQRGGAAPELSRVTFELSTNGGASWTALGAGVRVANTTNWQRTGLALPASGLLRARGSTSGGFHGGASGLIEQIVSFPPYTPLQQWKLTHLGDANAADLDDPDGDGIRTLAEYGLNLRPETFDASPLVPGRFDHGGGDRLRVFVPRNPAHNDVTVEVLAADTLGGPWSALATSTLGAPFAGPGYIGGDAATAGVKTVEVSDTVNISSALSRFIRVRVTR